ncbi:MAG: acetolactate decarboxylase [Mucilaginibacter sp.]|uniref:acetolactate decarboxylase n=1 Tax=Mucilaginibacter sp. TaxID=1882438 RepID=UPI0031A3B616
MEEYNKLYQFGVADAFVSGLYHGELPLSTLKENGDFGLGAPDLIDGELTMYNGKIYQTKSNGCTVEAPDTAKTPFAFVSHFKPDASFTFVTPTCKQNILEQLDTYLSNKNGMYAIRISGLFDQVKTRVYPPVTHEPFPPLADILNRQKFFSFNQIDGMLIGFKIPPYLHGINIKGYHFHFLSKQLTEGGHVLDFSINNVKAEVAILTSLNLVAQGCNSFAGHDFEKVA